MISALKARFNGSDFQTQIEKSLKKTGQVIIKADKMGGSPRLGHRSELTHPWRLTDTVSKRNGVNKNAISLFTPDGLPVWKEKSIQRLREKNKHYERIYKDTLAVKKGGKQVYTEEQARSRAEHASWKLVSISAGELREMVLEVIELEPQKWLNMAEDLRLRLLEKYGTAPSLPQIIPLGTRKRGFCPVLVVNFND